LCLVDARYSLDESGLKIRNITQADNGLYTCRVEVKSEGRYDEQRITVVVHSQYIFCILQPTMNNAAQGDATTARWL